MANTNTLKLTGLLILILGLSLVPRNTLSSSAQQGSAQETLARRTELLERKLAQDRRQADLDRVKRNFRKTRELLIKKGVPFDPEILLTANGRKTLAPHFATHLRS